MTLKLHKIALALSIACVFTSAAQANNLSISNVGLASRDPNTKALVVKFDVNWNNSWRNKINHDAVWLTVRLNNTQDSITNKKLCQITASGLNPVGSSVGTASNLEFYVPSDKRGAFLRRSSNGSVVNIATQEAQLTIDYSSCGFSDTDQVSVSIFGLEMVFIPQGDFYAGDNTSASSLNTHVISENAIPATGSNINIPASFPKGYAPLYVMKYEITEEQWVEFINSLGSSAARAHRDITDNNHKNSDSVIFRNTISCSGTPLVCTTDRPSRQIGFLNWMDLTAFLDWTALRPMTELEFEKIARGPLVAVAGEYAWGSTDITAAANISGSENGTEAVSDTNANANFDNTSFSGGDATQGAQYQQGPLRAGIFATSASDRISAGAGYYGVMDLSGSLKEQAVSTDNVSGVAFTGQHGDGSLATASGFEGNANTLNWPGLDSTIGHGITSATGSGFRGGSFSDGSSYLRISDRSEAGVASTSANSNFGGRGVRTYDGN